MCNINFWDAMVLRVFLVCREGKACAILMVQCGICSCNQHAMTYIPCRYDIVHFIFGISVALSEVCSWLEFFVLLLNSGGSFFTNLVEVCLSWSRDMYSTPELPGANDFAVRLLFFLSELPGATDLALLFFLCY